MLVSTCFVQIKLHCDMHETFIALLLIPCISMVVWARPWSVVVCCVIKSCTTTWLGFHFPSLALTAQVIGCLWRGARYEPSLPLLPIQSALSGSSLHNRSLFSPLCTESFGNLAKGTCWAVVSSFPPCASFHDRNSHVPIMSVKCQDEHFY